MKRTMMCQLCGVHVLSYVVHDMCKCLLCRAGHVPRGGRDKTNNPHNFHKQNSQGKHTSPSIMDTQQIGSQHSTTPVSAHIRMHMRGCEIPKFVEIRSPSSKSPNSPNKKILEIMERGFLRNYKPKSQCLHTWCALVAHSESHIDSR